ncbi:MAG: DUF2085 domain-containing protein [Candidatus Altiarchaeota archaeon]
MASWGHETLADLNYFIFKDICHQLPDRSIFLMGHQLGVCARDTGLYVGFLISSLLYPLHRRLGPIPTPPKWILFAAIVPLALDGTIQLVTSYESTNSKRLATGLLTGIVLPLYVIPVYYQIVDEITKKLGKKRKI